MYSLCGCGVWFEHAQARRTRCDRCAIALSPSQINGRKRTTKLRRKRYGPFVCRSPACRRAYMAKAPDRNTYCSRGCHAEHKSVRHQFLAHLQHIAHVPVPVPKVGAPPEPRGALLWKQNIKGRVIACSTCNALFSPLYGNHGRATCSDSCEEERWRDAKRSARRLRRRRTSVGRERVVRLRVFWRDKWKCRSCGCKAPQRLMGSMERNAPELDHIVPLAAGGTHTWANVQLLCRSCNGRKSSGALGDQLLLFGDA